MVEKYLRVRVEGKEGYLKAFLNDQKDKDSDPDYKGKGIAVWINEGRPEQDEPEQKPKVQASRL